jgi:hypothetical protein
MHSAIVVVKEKRNENDKRWQNSRPQPPRILPKAQFQKWPKTYGK